MSHALTIHGIQDLRLEERKDVALQSGEVRVALGAGGICGSDLHYYQHGGVGNFKLREPMVLGHEVAGTVVELGPEVTDVQVGQRVAVNPARPCLHCDQCLAGRSNLCRNVLFFGSAARFPHVQGGFSEQFVAHQMQCVPIPDSLSFELAAMAEPLAVTLHAVNQAGPLLGKRVLIVGAGPIGALTILSARLSGAREIVVADLQDTVLKVATQLGADKTVNLRHETLEGLEVDVAFEASGNAKGLETALGVLAPAGTLVQLGMLPAGLTPAPLNPLISREYKMIGSFRFGSEYVVAVDLLAKGRVDVTPLMTRSFPLSQASEAFVLAADRSQAMKVSLYPDQ